MIRVYTLADPRNNMVFYVGASKDTQKGIITRHHYNSSHFGTRKDLYLSGLTPLIEFIETINDPIEAAKLEEYWIWQFRAWGFKIENIRLCSGYSGSGNQRKWTPGYNW